MKGFGWIVILLAMLTAVYLVVQDLDALRGDRGGQAVVEPLARAKDAVKLVERTQDQLTRKLDQIDR